MDRAAAVAQMRFDYIGEVCSETVIKPRESKERTRSRQIDRFLTGKYTGIPAFIGIMGLVFWLTFNVIGAFLQGILEAGIEELTAMADAAMTAARRQQRGPVPGHRRDLRRRGRRSELPSDHRNAVFLPVAAGGQRL